jgi:lipopolysaccharide transport system permease protein
MSTGSILDSGDLIKGVFFPRAILPIATVLFNLSQFLLAAVVFIPALLVAFRRPLAAPMLLFPVFLFLQLLFTIGVAMTLSTCTAFFRDVKHLLEVSLALMFWTTPIVYDIARAPEAARTPILLSPMSPYIIAYQRMFYDGAWPSAAVTLAASLYALVALTLGTVVFVAYEDRFAEQV